MASASTFRRAIQGCLLARSERPEGEKKFDKNFGKVMSHYAGEIDVVVPLTAVPPGLERLEIKVSSQGCADAGLCYPPQEETISVTPSFRASLARKTRRRRRWPANAPAAPVQSSSAATSPMTAAAAQRPRAEPASDEEKISSTLQSGSIWKIALMFFGLGLLLSFTPCVLPMIPILSSIIVGSGGANGEAASRSKGFALSLAYSLGMILIYTSMGVAAGLLGEGLAATLAKALGHRDVLHSVCLASGWQCLTSSHSRCPQGVQNRLTEITNRIPGGKFTGVFAMGGLSALIVGPCVAAPLGRYTGLHQQDGQCADRRYCLVLPVAGHEPATAC